MNDETKNTPTTEIPLGESNVGEPSKNRKARRAEASQQRKATKGVPPQLAAQIQGMITHISMLDQKINQMSQMTQESLKALYNAHFRVDMNYVILMRMNYDAMKALKSGTPEDAPDFTVEEMKAYTVELGVVTALCAFLRRGFVEKGSESGQGVPGGQPPVTQPPEDVPGDGPE